MTDNTLDLGKTPQCRYCLTEDNFSDMVSPCKCTGSTKYVHRTCLLMWFDHKNGEYRCEICGVEYNCTYGHKITPKILCWNMFKYFLCVSTAIFTSYITGSQEISTGDSIVFSSTFYGTDLIL